MMRDLHNDRQRHIDDRASADRFRDRKNAAGIADNSAEIGDDAAGIVDIDAKVIPMLNSVLMSPK